MQLLLLLLPHGAAEERQERPARQQVDDGDGHEDQSVKDWNHCGRCPEDLFGPVAAGAARARAKARLEPELIEEHPEAEESERERATHCRETDHAEHPTAQALVHLVHGRQGIDGKQPGEGGEEADDVGDDAERVEGHRGRVRAPRDHPALGGDD